jgi:hypothetical protein
VFGRRLSPQRVRKGRRTERGVQHVSGPVLVAGAWLTRKGAGFAGGLGARGQLQVEQPSETRFFDFTGETAVRQYLWVPPSHGMLSSNPWGRWVPGS